MAQLLALLNSRVINLIFILFLALLALPQTVNRAVKPARGGSGQMLGPQAGHLVGFRKGRVYLATAGRAYQVEFLGTRGVEPLVGSSQGPVTYANLWPGIEVRYQKQAGGAVKSTFSLAPGADPGRIRLKYNVPVEIQPDGGLSIHAAAGELTEPAPSAWQTIGGRLMTIPAALVVLDGSEVGIEVGDYDPGYPLVIEK